MAKVKAGELIGVTNTEVLQEILHRYFTIGRPDVGELAYTSLVQMCLTVLPVGISETDKALQLLKGNERITSRDAIHAATMINHNIREIISADSHFDLIPQIKRIDPRNLPE